MPAILLAGQLEAVPTGPLCEGHWELERVSGTVPDPDRTARADCAVVAAGTDAAETVRAIHEQAPGLPVLYVTHGGVTDGVAAAREGGADDHVHVDGEADVDRLLARVERLAAPRLRADGDGPEGAAEAAPAGAGAADRRIRALLEHAGALMDAEDAEAVARTTVATAERVLGYEFVAVHLLDDRDRLVQVASTERSDELVGRTPPLPREETTADRALRAGEPRQFAVSEVEDVDLEPLESVLVVPLGEHGVLGFGSMAPEAFGEEDRQVAELLATEATGALDRISRLDRIEQLHRATQEMLDQATAEDVAERAVAAAEEILGYSHVGLHLVDDDGEALEAVAWTEATEDRYGVPPDIVADRGGPWVAFERGELRYYDRNRPEACQGSTPYEAQMHVPVGEHGVLLVAAYEPAAFDDTDRQLARVLAANAARTLDRVERTEELERYESVFETVTDMVYVLDEEGCFTHVTPALTERFGYDPGALEGRHVSELIDDHGAISRGVDLVQELLGEPPGESRTQRLEVTTAGGEEIPVEVDVTLLPGEGFRGIVGTVRDISDLLAVRERLDSQEDRFEYLFEHIPDPVVEVDLEGATATTVSVNGAFEEVFGYEAEAVRGRPVDEVIAPPEARERAAELTRDVAGGEIVQAEVERETRFGVREFLFRGVPYTTADGTTRGFGIYTDITDQRERERHLEVLQRVLRHNVRNDVNVLLGGLENLDDAGADPETLATLEETAEGLLAMSRKAKRIGRVLEAEREQRETVDLAALADDVVERYRAADVDATIATDVPDSAPVVGSRAIAHAIEDLVGNGVEHAGEQPRIEVSVERGAQRTSVTVSDDGPGIPAEERRVLEEAEITPLHHGSGLGLWLVKHATAASGGTVDFEDEPGGGACVRLSFKTSDEA